eukprot:5998303-Amphidinium_carterae.2
MSARQRDGLSGTYMTLLRKLTHLHNPELLRHVTDEKLLAYLGEPSLEQLFDHRASVHMAKACASANPQIQAALRCHAECSVWGAWVPTLTRLHQLSADLAHMPVPSLDNLEPSKRAFIKVCKAKADTTKMYSIIAANIEEPPIELPGIDDAIGADGQPETNGPTLTFQCDLCPAKFKANQGLSVHLLRHHGIVSPLSLRAWGTECGACGAKLGTRNRLLLHLNGKASCGLWTLQNVEPMDYDYYKKEVGRLNQIDDRLTRDKLPKTGPIPRLHDRYVSQHVTPLNPFLAAPE